MGFLGQAGVEALWAKVKANFGRSLEISGGTTIKLKDGAGTPGTLSEVTIPDATTSTAGAMSASDKSKLNGIATGANKYSHPTSSGNKHIPSGGSSGQILRWSADGTAAWGADNDTVYTHPSYTAKSAGLYKVTVDATGHVSAATAAAKADITALGIPAQDTTYSEATTSAAGLLSATDKTKLDGIAAGAEVNQNAFSTIKAGSVSVKADSKTDAVTLSAGSNVAIVGNASDSTITISATNTTYSAATTSKAGLMSAADKTKLDGIATGATAVTMDQVNSAIASAQVGAAMYKGAVSSNSTISGSSYKAGWYWVVSTAGTYVGETCEVGDMIFANTDKGSAYSAAHFDVVQNNIVEMTASEVEAVCTL